MHGPGARRSASRGGSALLGFVEDGAVDPDLGLDVMAPVRSTNATFARVRVSGSWSSSAKLAPMVRAAELYARHAVSPSCRMVWFQPDRSAMAVAAWAVYFPHAPVPVAQGGEP